MPETLEQIPPEEVDEEKLDSGIAGIAHKAAQEMDNILQSGGKEDSLENMTEVAQHLKAGGQKSDLENIQKSLETSHLHFPDQKNSELASDIEDTADFLEKFIDDPNTTRMQYPAKAAQTLQFLKSLSYFESMKEK